MNIQEIRAKYPQYDDLSDDQLLQGFHKKFYSDMPYEAFAAKVGAGATAQEQPKSWQSRLASEIGGMVTPVAKSYRDFGSGAIRGAGSIGATILSPLDALGITGMTNDERRTKMDEGLRSLFGADTDSLAYSGGKLGAEIAGTAGAGGMLAKGMSVIPQLAKFAPVVESGGFNLGNAATASKLTNAALRTGGGMVTGGATAGLINPEDAPMGVAFGGAMPGVVKVAGEGGKMVAKGLDSASRKLMNSALKPTIEMHRKGQAARAVQTMLDEGLNATQGGVNKLKDRINLVNDDISNAVQGSDATISKSKVATYLDGLRDKLIMQADPASALNAIDNAESSWMNHPLLGGNSAPQRKAQTVFVDSYGSVVKPNIPPEPKLRNLLDEIKRAGGINVGEQADIGVEKMAKNYPGLMRKDGGMKMDRLVEWMDQNGWIVPGQIDDLERNAVGGSHEYARDMLRGALNREEVIHPYDYDAYANFVGAMKQLDEQGIKQVKIPGTEKAIPSDYQIPVKMAQELKKGTYKTLSKSYGEMKGAEIEAQKALARGLKEEIAQAVTGIDKMNKRESDLLNALKVTERRTMMDANKNPVGLGPLAPNKAMLLAFLADRSAALKSFGARGLYQASRPDISGLLANAGSDPLLRSGLLAISANP